MLIEVIKRWNKHLLMIKWLKKLFDYVDRSHVYHNGLQNLQYLGVNSYKQ